ncbi:NERD domain-containing protein [Bacillus sp. DNRA2]|nr:nuclease-related domain-containing protein [Bacillus sp. DNRA2]NMD70072.1 NERD domain-containing protein [Bacillus sp. DNRA2]
MFVKERKTPLIVREIDAILNRIPLTHSKRSILEENRTNYMKGFRGEKQIDYYLEELKASDYLIFADLRLISNTNRAFQMDTLLISPYFFLIIESKHIAGTLIFEKDSTQMIRELDGIKQGFTNPIVQVARHKVKLIDWLTKHKIPKVPIEDLVGIADRRTLIVTTHDNKQIYQKLIYADVILQKIRQFESIFTEKILTNRQIQQIKKLLLKSHTPVSPTILKKYNINPTELKKGIQCPECGQFHMTRETQNWYCAICKTYNRNAHIKAVEEYFLIFATEISNKQFREFVLLCSRNISKKLLLRMNLPTTGANKNRLYHRPPDF